MGGDRGGFAVVPVIIGVVEIIMEVAGIRVVTAVERPVTPSAVVLFAFGHGAEGKLGVGQLPAAGGAEIGGESVLGGAL